MSRLIVKNLPGYVTSSRLREHFEQVGSPTGTLTDVKVALKPDGTSRRFGFIGYKTESEARAAQEWFDKTFIDSARLNVAFSEGAKDAPTPRPNKRPRLGPAPHDEPQEKWTKKKNRENDQVNPTKKRKDREQEFVEIMQTSVATGPTWANEKRAENPTTTEAEPPPVTTEGMSDLDWMQQRMSSTMEPPGQVFEQDEEDKPADLEEKTHTAIDPVEETIRQTARLFIRNLAFSCTESDLTDLFDRFGELSQIHIPIDTTTGQSKGFAYVTFAFASAAVAAYQALDKTAFQGRLLHVLGAIDRKSTDNNAGKLRTVKEEKNAKRKQAALKDFNWSMLYMNSDAVASSIADRLSIPKSDILNPEGSDNGAVKLALAETHIINETKAYLETHGVVLSSFSGRPPRSDTIILVKNIPYGTGEDQIRGLFEPHGTVSRVLVPPAGTMAVVEFERVDESRQAFKAVAYRRLGNSVIYLEKGPVGMFAAPDQSSHGSTSTSGTSSGKATLGDAAGTGLPAAPIEDSSGLGTTLFVKNLAFSTTQERLTQVFRNLPSFSFARVQTKPDPKRPPDGRLSMGFGFVGFADAEGARMGMRSMQGFMLDGHALHIQFAGRGTEEEANKSTASSKTRTTKIIVKNVPFEATKKDIRSLFQAHGHLKSVRVPKKFDSRSRGFAFLEFVSHQEAQNAFNMLQHTHLLGRHLVLEWAELAEVDLDGLRHKASVGFGEGKTVPGRKRGLEL